MVAMVCGVDIRPKIIRMSRGLDKQKGDIENDRYDADKDQLLIGKVRPDRRDRIVGKNKCEYRKGCKDAEIDTCAGSLEFLFVMTQSAPQDAHPDKAIAHDHNDGKHGVAGEGR